MENTIFDMLEVDTIRKFHTYKAEHITEIPDMCGLVSFLYRKLFAVITEHAEVSADEYEAAGFEISYLKQHDPKNDKLNLKMYEFDHARPDLDLTEKFCNALANDFYNGEQLSKDYLLAIFKYYEKDKYKRLKKYTTINLRMVREDDFMEYDSFEDESDIAQKMEQMTSFFEDTALIIAVSLCMNIKIEKDLWLLIGEHETGSEFLIECIRSTENQQRDADGASFDFEREHESFHTAMNKAREALEKHPARTHFKNARKITKYQLTKNKLRDYTESRLDEFEIFDDLYDLFAAGIDVNKMNEKDLASIILFNHNTSRWIKDMSSKSFILSSFTGDDTENAVENLAFEPVQLKVPTVTEPKSVKQEPMIAKAVRETDLKVNNEELLAVISDQRAKRQKAEWDVQRQRELYEKTKTELQQAQNELQELRKSRIELEALRKFAYEAAEGDIKPEKAISREEKISFLQGKRGVIVGGHDNWTYKLKQLFPKWRFATAEEQGSVPVAIIDKADCVFMYTDHLCHSQYYRYLDAIRTSGVRLEYVAQVNIEANIDQFYRALKD